MKRSTMNEGNVAGEENTGRLAAAGTAAPHDPARLIVCERTGHWAVALRRELAEAGVRVWETRTLADCWSELAKSPASFLVLELGDNLAGLLGRMARQPREYPAARLAVVADRSLADYESLMREAGAVHFLSSPRQTGPLARLAGRHLAQVPPPPAKPHRADLGEFAVGSDGGGRGTEETKDQGMKAHASHRPTRSPQPQGKRTPCLVDATRPKPPFGPHWPSSRTRKPAAALRQLEQIHGLRLDGQRLSITLGLTTWSAPVWEQTRAALAELLRQRFPGLDVDRGTCRSSAQAGEAGRRLDWRPRRWWRWDRAREASARAPSPRISPMGCAGPVARLV